MVKSQTRILGLVAPQPSLSDALSPVCGLHAHKGLFAKRFLHSPELPTLVHVGGGGGLRTSVHSGEASAVAHTGPWALAVPCAR